MEWVPKTIVFAKDNAFCKKITYKVGKKTAEESIKAFRTDPLDAYHPAVVTTPTCDIIDDHEHMTLGPMRELFEIF